MSAYWGRPEVIGARSKYAFDRSRHWSHQRLKPIVCHFSLAAQSQSVMISIAEGVAQGKTDTLCLAADLP
jgi:hypothetical protein